MMLNTHSHSRSSRCWRQLWHQCRAALVCTLHHATSSDWVAAAAPIYSYNQRITASPVIKKIKGSPHSITKCRVLELIPVLGSQPAGDVSHKPGCHYFLSGSQLPSQPLRGLLPISLLGEQRHDGCEQFA